MKYFLPLILACCLLVGCGAQQITPEETIESYPEPSTTQIAETEATAPTGAPSMVSYTLYLPNDNADGFVETVVTGSQITAEGVLLQLQQHGALPDNVEINSFTSEGTRLDVDLNQAFGDLVCSMGTSGELMIVGSFVNTYLNAFQADSLFFTVEGEILESGHVIYDFPLEFYELNFES